MRPKANNVQGHSLDVSDAKDALSGNEYQLGVVPEIELIPSRHPGKAHKRTKPRLEACRRWPGFMILPRSGST